MLTIPGVAATELGRLQVMLAAVEAAAVQVFCQPNAWPETVRNSVQFGGNLTVQVRGIRKDAQVRRGIGARGVYIDGVILLRRSDLGLLGANRNMGSALALYGALLLDTISFPVAQIPDNSPGPSGGDITIGDVQIVNTAGDGKTDLALLVPWTIRTAFITADLANDPRVS